MTPSEVPESTGSAKPRTETPLTPESGAGGEWLRAALARARARPTDPSGELTAAVRAYARQLRSSGVPPERVIVMLKAQIRDTFDDLAVGAAQRTLAEQIVSSAIAAYYSEP